MQKLNSSSLRPNGSNHSINTNSSTYISATLIALSTLIVLSNGTLLLLYLRKSNLRSKKNFLLASLALSDLFSGMVVLPVFVSCFQTPSDWNLCLSSAILFRFLAFSTVLHILAITFEKYLSIIDPLYHQGFVHRKHLRVTSGLIWGTSTGLSLVPMAWHFEGNKEEIFRKDLIYFIATFIVCFILPLILMTFAHIRMFKTISKSFQLISGLRELPLGNSQSDGDGSTTGFDYSRRYSSNTKKIITLITLMLGTFVVCWLTWYLGAFFFYLDVQSLKLPPLLNNILLTLVFLPSLINPVLYTYYKQDFRNALKSLFFKRSRNITIWLQDKMLQYWRWQFHDRNFRKNRYNYLRIQTYWLRHKYQISKAAWW